MASLGDLVLDYIFVRNLLGPLAHQLPGFSSPASLLCMLGTPVLMEPSSRLGLGADASITSGQEF